MTTITSRDLQAVNCGLQIQSMFPYLCVTNAAAIEFYLRAFGASETIRLAEPRGRIGHAERTFGPTTRVLSDEFPEIGIRSASSIGATSVTIRLHVDDADAMIERAVQAGATLERAREDHSYGERPGTLRDPFGHRWPIGHPVEDVSSDAMQRRYPQLLSAEGSRDFCMKGDAMRRRGRASSTSNGPDQIAGM